MIGPSFSTVFNSVIARTKYTFYLYQVHLQWLCGMSCSTICGLYILAAVDNSHSPRGKALRRQRPADFRQKEPVTLLWEDVASPSRGHIHLSHKDRVTFRVQRDTNAAPDQGHYRQAHALFNLSCLNRFDELTQATP